MKRLHFLMLLLLASVVSMADNKEYVDLGLPSGTLWAKCNVGASAPEGYGSYFAWGETKTKSTISTPAAPLPRRLISARSFLAVHP